MNNLGILLIDMQDFFIKRCHPKEIELLIESQKKLFNFTYEKRVPIFVLEYFPVGETTEKLEKELSKNKNYFVRKEGDNGFIVAPPSIEDTFEEIQQNRRFRNLLEKEKIQNLILTGVHKDACVLKTAIGAKNRNYNIFTSEELCDRTKKEVQWFYENSNHYQTLSELLNVVSSPKTKSF
jgi:nicotinamidase-related amidase